MTPTTKTDLAEFAASALSRILDGLIGRLRVRSGGFLASSAISAFSQRVHLVTHSNRSYWPAFYVMSLLVIVFAALTALAAEPKSDDLPTFIKSDSLTLRSNERVFVYSGNVEVRRGDMIMTSDSLEGTYDENNKVQRLVGRKNVTITKGDKIRATSERATYITAEDSLILTENPELQENGSVLTADTIRIFLKDDRSTAEGSVRVKLVNKGDVKEGAGGTPASPIAR